MREPPKAVPEQPDSDPPRPADSPHSGRATDLDHENDAALKSPADIESAAPEATAEVGAEPAADKASSSREPQQQAIVPRGVAEQSVALQVTDTGTPVDSDDHERPESARDRAHRLEILRLACARERGTEGRDLRALHDALSAALALELESTPRGPRRVRLLHERARALEAADRGREAGEIYEGLGELHKAADAYRRAGQYLEYEFVEAATSTRDHERRRRLAIDRELDELDASGRRNELARALSLEIERIESELDGRTTSPAAALAELSPTQHAIDLQTRLRNLRASVASLEGRTLAQPSLELTWTSTLQADSSARRGKIRIFFHGELRIGRTPGLELVVDDPEVSRHHLSVRHRSACDTEPSSVSVCDHRSRAGTFWEDEALVPESEYPLPQGRQHMALGSRSWVELHVGERGQVTAVANDDGTRCAALPGDEGSLVIPSIDDAHPLAQLHLNWSGRFPILSSVAADVSLELRPGELIEGEGVEILAGDTVRCIHSDGRVALLEVSP